MKIVVTGSLGHIGRPLTANLAAKGHEVTVITSSAERQTDIEALNAAAAVGSLKDADFLAATFEGADAVFAMEPPNYGEPDVREYYRAIGRNYVRAIEKAGVRHVVHLSSVGAHLPAGTGFILGSHDVEGILDGLSGVSVTHLRPTYFYYNLLNYIDTIKTAGFIASNYGGEDRLVMVAPSDIADAAAEELESGGGSDRKIRYIASDERNANEIAKVLGTAIGKPDLEWKTFTDEQTQAGMEEKGVPPHIASDFVELGSSIHSGLVMEDFDRNKPESFGKVKLEDFAKEFAEAYQEK